MVILVVLLSILLFAYVSRKDFRVSLSLSLFLSHFPLLKKEAKCIFFTLTKHNINYIVNPTLFSQFRMGEGVLFKSARFLNSKGRKQNNRKLLPSASTQWCLVGWFFNCVCNFFLAFLLLCCQVCVSLIFGI